MLKPLASSRTLRKRDAVLDQIAREKGIDQDKTEIWFGDEAGVGQKNKFPVARPCAERGLSARDQRTASIYISVRSAPRRATVRLWCSGAATPTL